MKPPTIVTFFQAKGNRNYWEKTVSTKIGKEWKTVILVKIPGCKNGEVRTIHTTEKNAPAFHKTIRETAKTTPEFELVPFLSTKL